MNFLTKLKCGLVAMGVVVAFAVTARADTQTVGGYTWTYWINGDATASIHDVTPKPTGGLTIPSALGGKPVTGIEDYAFGGCVGLNTVTLPASVTDVATYAFNTCSGLRSFTVADANPAYKSVDGFLLTKNGKTLVQGVTGADGKATIPDGVTVIGNVSFGGLTNMTSVTIPSSVTLIAGKAFDRCIRLLSVTIPDSVTNIAQEAFSDCSGLAYASLPGHLKGKIDKSKVFRYCPSGLVVSYRGIDPEFTIEDGELTHVELNGATSVTIPASVTSIGYRAFRFYSGLTSVTIPDSVTNIAQEAFGDCNGLTSVTIPDSVTSIGKWAFYGCSGLTRVTIPNSVTSIGYGAFFGCSGLTSVTIPASVTSIGYGAFSSCSGLTSISVGSGNADYKSVNGLLLSKDGKTLIAVPGGLASVTIPNSVTSIGKDAFRYCIGLTLLETYERDDP